MKLSTSFVPPVRGDLLPVRLLELVVLQPAGGDGLLGLVPLPLQLGRSLPQLGRLLLQLPHRPLQLPLPGDGPAQQASTLAALLRLTMGLKSAVVLEGNGLMVPSPYRTMPMLDCYCKASLCDDPTAYCQVVINDPFRQRVQFGLHDLADRQADPWVLRCHRTKASYLHFDAHHAASASTLVQAAAVRHGSSWCPHFRAGDFRPVVEAGSASVQSNHPAAIGD